MPTVAYCHGVETRRLMVAVRRRWEMSPRVGGRTGLCESANTCDVVAAEGGGACAIEGRQAADVHPRLLEEEAEQGGRELKRSATSAEAVTVRARRADECCGLVGYQRSQRRRRPSVWR